MAVIAAMMRLYQIARRPYQGLRAVYVIRHQREVICSYVPIGFGYVEGITHGSARHGTTTLFAALDV